ncbi:unnamed protein product (mitochondrion) [Plasmodiophora brassicae]|uniref:Uncharacterized protein n=1 Tax=Plasmodiophora brassicae TaxID=37360 RepID=A0A0G4J5W2_PLABS|nr:hypothetical protein PBRA_002608 [Plasmodiophora brassicae]SPQ94771.1 unnamed protein product [Plasmodiophora brassicae]
MSVGHVVCVCFVLAAIACQATDNALPRYGAVESSDQASPDSHAGGILLPTIASQRAESNAPNWRYRQQLLCARPHFRLAMFLYTTPIRRETILGIMAFTVAILQLFLVVSRYVQYTTRPYDDPALKSNDAPRMFVCLMAFVTLLTGSFLSAVIWAHSRNARHLGIRLFAWAAILNVMTTAVRLPYIASDIVQAHDWQAACGSSSVSLMTDGSGRWWMNNAEVGQTTIQDAADGSSTTLTFHASGLASMPAANPVTTVKIIVDRMGNGVVVGSCFDPNRPCDLATGSIAVRTRRRLAGFVRSSSAPETTMFASNNADWGNNPFALYSIDDNSIAMHTVVQPSGPGIRICSSNVQLAFLTAALVNAFQARVATCNHCHEQCLTASSSGQACSDLCTVQCVGIGSRSV